MNNNEPMTNKDQFWYVFLGMAIGFVYVGIFMSVVNFDSNSVEIIPKASTQTGMGLLLIGFSQVAWNKGKKMPKGFGEKIREIRTGCKLSESTKQKISNKLKGNTNPLGCKRSEATKAILSAQKKGKSNHREGTHHKPETIAKIKAQKGWKHSPEARRKIKKWWEENDHPFLGKKRPIEVGNNIRKGRKYVIPPIIRSEREVAKILKKNGVEVEHQKLFEYKDWYVHADLFVKPNFVFELDTKYTHSKPRHVTLDIQENKNLPKIGMKLTRIIVPDKQTDEAIQDIAKKILVVLR